MITEVCERMNHCIQGGFGDRDGGEDNGEGSKECRAAAASAAARVNLRMVLIEPGVLGWFFLWSRLVQVYTGLLLFEFGLVRFLV